MVERLAGDLKFYTAHAVTLGTQDHYSPELQNFGDFAEWLQPPLPEDMFDVTRHTREQMNAVIMYYSLFLRRFGVGLKRDQNNQPMPMLSATISNKITGLIDCLGKCDGTLVTWLHRDRICPTEMSRALKGMNRIDHILRGHADLFCKLPAGMQFVEELILTIGNVYAGNLQMIMIYSVLALVEYMFGARTYQVMVKSKIAHMPEPGACVPCGPSGDPLNLTTLDALERTASCHSARVCDVQFNWPNSKSLFAYQWNELPDEIPDSISMYGTEKNNPFGTKHPSSIMINPHLPGSSQLCLVTMLYSWIKNTPARNADQFLFIGASDTQFMKLIKLTAKHVGYPEDRTVNTSLRIGCESATTQGLLDLTQTQMSLIVQDHQHWLTPHGSAPYHISQLVNGVLKTIQLYHRATTSIQDVLVRFCRRTR